MTDIEILRKKQEFFSQIYDITKDTNFKGDDNDAQAYVYLMEKREQLFAQIKILDDKISGIAPSKEAESVIADIKKTVKSIIALDQANEAVTSRIMSGLKKSLKGINEGKNASVRYTDYIATSDGMYFDQKN